jgi:hypothetical protein
MTAKTGPETARMHARTVQDQQAPNAEHAFLALGMIRLTTNVFAMKNSTDHGATWLPRQLSATRHA